MRLFGDLSVRYREKPATAKPAESQGGEGTDDQPEGTPNPDDPNGTLADLAADETDEDEASETTDKRYMNMDLLKQQRMTA